MQRSQRTEAFLFPYPGWKAASIREVDAMSLLALFLLLTLSSAQKPKNYVIMFADDVRSKQSRFNASSKRFHSSATETRPFSAIQPFEPPAWTV